MAKFACICGQVIRMSGSVPNPDEWICLSDLQLEEFWGRAISGELSKASVKMYRCPRSDHLWVFWDGLNRLPRVYAPMNLQLSESWLGDGPDPIDWEGVDSVVQ